MKKLIPVILISFLLIAGCSMPIGNVPTNSADPGLRALYDEYLAKYNQIEKDMNYEDVEKLMGKPGKDLAKSVADAPTHSAVPHPLNAYVWESSDEGSSGIQVSVLFTPDGGSVLTKRFNGLAIALMPQAARTTKDKFGELKKGMTYDEAVSVLGSQGFMWQTSKTYTGEVSTFETYAWWQNDNPTSMMTVMFQNEKAVTIDNVK